MERGVWRGGWDERGRVYRRVSPPAPSEHAAGIDPALRDSSAAAPCQPRNLLRHFVLIPKLGHSQWKGLETIK